MFLLYIENYDENNIIIIKEFVEYLLSIVKKNANKPIEFFKPENFDNGLYIHPPYNQRCIVTFFNKWSSVMYPKDKIIHGKYVYTYLVDHDLIDKNRELIIDKL